MAEVEKVAISLPANLLKKVESIRKTTGESRSAFIRRAIESALAARDREALIAKYEDGYRKNPETPDEIAAAEAAAIALLAGEPWE